MNLVPMTNKPSDKTTPSKTVVVSIELDSEASGTTGSGDSSSTSPFSFTGGPSGQSGDPHNLGGFNLAVSSGILEAVDDTVKIDGEEAEVTLEEALSGYQRERTFHKRMNEVSQKSKAIEAKDAETKQLRDQYAEGLQQLEQALKVPEPNWEELRRTKTNDEFASIHAEYQIQQNNLLSN